VLIGISVTAPLLRLPNTVSAPLEHLVSLGLIASVAWLAIALMNVAEDVATARFPTDQKENLQAITNTIAGLQIALTEPIRLDDVVIIDGEWGRIEEITTTFVVIRIWDLRRLVVPLSYFIDKPFQNWTRVTADLLGGVFIYADYLVPVDEVRRELHRVLEESGMWDGKVWGLQVSNATEHTIELRGLMSAPDSSRAWDLRCYVREKLIAFLQERYPTSLPRLRVELRPVTDGGIAEPRPSVALSESPEARETLRNLV
jgi:hypothetical protein